MPLTRMDSVVAATGAAAGATRTAGQLLRYAGQLTRTVPRITVPCEAVGHAPTTQSAGTEIWAAP